MNKENNRSAAGLRRSAIAERIRLREEWSELKGTPEELPLSQNSQRTRVLTKKPQPTRNNVNRRPVPKSAVNRATESANVAKSVQMSSEVLVGVVALVEVGAEPRALALRAALAALGASVVPAWSPIVTHVVWAEGGCRATRGRARALAARLVSPLWVEACAAACRRLPEQAFPAAARASDLPSPRTLRQLLKKAEMENIPILDLLSDDDKDNKPLRLRMSSETEIDTSADTTTDTSRDTSHDTSRDKTEIESRVNTAPRRAMPISISPAPPARSRRKLFTQKEAEVTKASDDSDVPAPARPPQAPAGRARSRRLARAERLARRLARACAAPAAPAPTARDTKPRIVLTGMGKTERQSVLAAIRSLNGKVQSNVTWKTTHVLLGSCREDDNGNICSGITTTLPSHNPNISGVASLPLVVHRSDVTGARTLNALLGAARGCRVLRAGWAQDCLAAKTWLHHHGYEVPHLKKIAQKARIERTALCRMRSDYAYDVFNGMRVRLTSQAEQKPAAIQLLKLCGAVVLEGDTELQEDMVVGTRDGEVGSKWVFDSVAAGRMRTARRYVNNTLSGTVITQTNR